MNDHPWGRMAEDGTVFVRLLDGNEKAVGQWAAGADADAALRYYQRRYLDVLVEADLALKRVQGGQATPEQALAAAERLRAAVKDPSGIGDLSVLVERATQLEERATFQAEKAAKQKKQAKVDAIAKREQIAAEAEKLADSEQWKASGERYRDLLDEWKSLPRFDKGKEQALWKRFSHARSEFDKRRRVHFTEMDAQRAHAVVAKEALIRRAEALSSSTDWGPTSRAYRDLMEEWKKAPRAARAVDDSLWKQFRAAQDTFFEARNALNAERDASEQANLVKKRELIEQAEAISIGKDPRAARAKYRRVLDQWDEIGDVPRPDRPKLERRLRTVENNLAKSERAQWKRTDPAARARAEATVQSFQDAFDKLVRQRDAAAEAGNTRKVKDLESSMASSRMLLDSAKRTLEDFTD